MKDGPKPMVRNLHGPQVGMLAFTIGDSIPEDSVTPRETTCKKDGTVGFLSSPNDAYSNRIQFDEDDSKQGSEESVQQPLAQNLDLFALPEILDDDGKKWKDMSCGERCGSVAVGVLKAAALLGLLYTFICSLGLLSDSFRLIGGRVAGGVFRDSALLRNPICGLMIGVLATVILQSSSTSTSIVVSMVASDIVEVGSAIPIVMGANIGTSLTNTLVSVAHSSRRAEFRRAFAGATVHDMFNWLCVICLLPLEVACGYLYHLTSAIIGTLHLESKNKPPKLLKVITDPVTKLIIQLDKSKIEKIAIGGEEQNETISLIKRWCTAKDIISSTNSSNTSDTALIYATDVPKVPLRDAAAGGHLFASTSMSDLAVGLILLCVSLTLLVACLVCVVKVLHGLLRGQIASTIRKTINNDLPGCFSCLTGYVTILIGAVMTILVQSSSVFTSALTPLVGIGVLSLERMYPLTLGSNVGTTFTSLLAALASPPNRLASALQISLCHLFFNVSGIGLFYVVPITRQVPIGLAKLLGTKTAEYRWIAVLYVIAMFFLLPGAIFGLSMAGSALLWVGIPFASLTVVVALINVLQVKRRKWLPKRLRNWNFLPLWLHSLEPMDRAIGRVGDAIQKICPFCSTGWWSCCIADPEPPIDDGVAGPNRCESRKQLLKISPGNSTNPSRLASRASSPSRGRKSYHYNYRKTEL